MNPVSLDSPFNTLNNTVKPPAQTITPGEAHSQFKTMLNDALSDVNELQNVSSKKTEDLALGKPVELHDVMITGQKASVTLQATIEIRNKVVEAYQEIMRMQV